MALKTKDEKRDDPIECVATRDHLNAGKPCYVGDDVTHPRYLADRLARTGKVAQKGSDAAKLAKKLAADLKKAEPEKAGE